MDYSIIIPHKNVPHLLKRCLDSIPIREGLEVIIVDDNSNNQKIDINLFPGKDRIDTTIIFLTESHGAGYARNVGIKKARGKWILFADADDYFTDKLSELLDKYKNDEKYDLVYLNSQKVNERGEMTPGPFCKYFERYKQGKKYSEDVVRYNMWTPWSRMVKKSVITEHSLEFEEIPVANDRYFSLNCSRYAKKIFIEHSVIYIYYKPEKGSITDRYAMKTSNVLSRLNTQKKINILYKDVKFPFKGSFCLQFLSYLKFVDNKKELCSIFYKFVRDNKICLPADLYNLVRRQIACYKGIL